MGPEALKEVQRTQGHVRRALLEVGEALEWLPGCVARGRIHTAAALLFLATLGWIKAQAIAHRRPPTPKRLRGSPTVFECVVCMETLGEGSSVPWVACTPCGHGMCAACVEPVVRRSQRATCPMAGCEGCLPPGQLSDVTCAALQGVLARQRVAPSGTLVCRVCTAPVQHTPEEAAGAAPHKCLVCEVLTCGRCLGVFHPGRVCMAALLQGRDASVQDLLSEAKMTVCTQCKAPVTKDAGCNHITCACGRHFCFLCGVTLDHLDPAAHYRAPGVLCTHMSPQSVEAETERMIIVIRKAVGTGLTPVFGRPLTPEIAEAAVGVLTTQLNPLAQALTDL